MIERADALHHYGEVAALDMGVVTEIENGCQADGLLQTPTTRAKVLHSFDPSGSVIKGHVAYPGVSPVSRPLNYLIYRAFAEIEPDQDRGWHDVVATFFN